jgi:hypothetical protein
MVPRQARSGGAHDMGTAESAWRPRVRGKDDARSTGTNAGPATHPDGGRRDGRVDRVARESDGLGAGRKGLSGSHGAFCTVNLCAQRRNLPVQRRRAQAHGRRAENVGCLRGNYRAEIRLRARDTSVAVCRSVPLGNSSAHRPRDLRIREGRHPAHCLAGRLGTSDAGPAVFPRRH